MVEGMLRAYTLSAEGREITLYRLYERDICLFSAPCMLHSIQFDLSISAEQDAVYDLIPTPVFRALMQKSAAVANYINELMASRFSDVMWLLDQILSKKMDARLAAFLVEECERYDTLTLSMTHDEIARHLGTAREVVTRMLNYMSSEQIVRLSRGCIEILQPQRLQRCASGSLR